MLGLKKSILGAKTLPRWVPTWASKTEFFEAQVGLHFGGVLAALGRRRPLFLDPMLAPYPDPLNSQTIAVKKEPKPQGSIFGPFSIVSNFRGSELGLQLGVQKKCPMEPQGRQDPPKMEANLGLKKFSF